MEMYHITVLLDKKKEFAEKLNELGIRISNQKRFDRYGIATCTLTEDEILKIREMKNLIEGIEKDNIERIN